MFNIDVKEFSHKGIHTYIVPTEKFKTITISLKLKTPIKREDVTKRALLTQILDKAAENYPSSKAIKMKLDDLYGAVFGIGNGKNGSYHTMSFNMEIANEKFLQNKVSLLEDSLKLITEILYRPLLENGHFKEKIVEREKRTLLSNLKSIKDNKVTYANRRLLEEMCQGERAAIFASGYEEDLEKITAEGLFAYYEKMLQEDIFDLYIVGDLKTEEVTELVKEVFTYEHKRTPFSEKAEVKEVESVKEVTEREPINQAKLHIGYRTYTTLFDEDMTALQLFNGLFGAFPNSKLFKNVREKHSLAYYVSSRLSTFSGHMIVFSGIAPSDHEKAQEIIEQELKAMQAGDFTDEEMAEMKSLIVSNTKEAFDSASGIITMLYNRHIFDLNFNMEKRIEDLMKVTREDVIRVANKIKKDTVYLLTEEEGA